MYNKQAIQVITQGDSLSLKYNHDKIMIKKKKKLKNKSIKILNRQNVNYSIQLIKRKDI